MAAATISERMAEYVLGLRFEDIPSAVVERTKDHLVHHFGLAFGGNFGDGGRKAIRVARELSGPSGDATVVGQREKFSAIDAVFANSRLMSHGGMDDFQLPGGCHPGVIAMPIGLAVGERERASGQELIAAIVVGYDLMCKLSKVGDSWNAPSPRRPNSVYGPLGGAATASRLMKLSHEQAVQALGHGANASLGLVESSDHMQFNHPQLARNGLLAALMARADIGMSRTMVEGEHGLLQSFFGQIPDGLEQAMGTLGSEFEITRTSTKRYRSSGINIVPMQLTLELVKQRAIRGADVETVTVLLPVEREERESVWEALYAGGPRTLTSRQGILRFLLAVILTDGRINEQRYEEDESPELLAMLGKITLRFEPGHPIRYARVQVALGDGRTHVIEGDDHVFPRSDWAEWLEADGRRLVDRAQLVRLAQLSADLDRVRDVNELTACLVPA